MGDLIDIQSQHYDYFIIEDSVANDIDKEDNDENN